MNGVRALPHRDFPCDECPFRVDNCRNPRAKFPAERWAELSATVRDPQTGYQPMPGDTLFGCHKGAPGTDADLMCAGWLATVGRDHVGVRLAVVAGRLPEMALEPGPNWPALYESWEDTVRAQTSPAPPLAGPATSGTAPGSGRPVVAVDVDGVLNPDDPAAAERAGYQPHQYDGPGPDGVHVSGTVWLHPDHGRWLTRLAEAGADLVWCTSWRHLAATWIAPRLGLPTTLDVIDVVHTGVRWGRQGKLAALYNATGTRPVAVLDDDFGGRDFGEAADRTDRGIPTLLVPVFPGTGLQPEDIDTVLAWLAQPHVVPNPAHS